MGGHVLSYYLMLMAAALVVYWRGSKVEKLGILVAILGSTVTTLLSSPYIWGDISTSLFIVDLSVLFGFWLLALFSNRFWPYWATGWQLVGTLIHIQRALFDDILEKPYGLLSMYISYPILGVILAAALMSETKSVAHNAKSSKMGQENAHWKIDSRTK